MKTKKELAKVNDVYKKNIEHWDYYWRSYVGGHQYRQGAYLRKYLNEDAAPGDQYGQRLLHTALQNHVKSVVHIYRSFLFRHETKRILGSLSDNPLIENWMTDVDLNGTDIDQFMKRINDSLMVYGSCWVVADRPAYKTHTVADEMKLGIRAYVNMYVPTQVLDWEYSTDVNGKKILTCLKLVEDKTEDYVKILVWYPDRIERYWCKSEKLGLVPSDPFISLGEVEKAEQYINPLGFIPAFNINVDTDSDGIGNSQISDIADTQKSIYNRLSELEQNIRISGHPTLVKTAETKASAGAGAVITVDDQTPGELKPYLLQPNGSTSQSILAAIEMDITAIDKMAHVSGIRGTTNTAMSGVALQTEMQLLNSRLSDMANVLQEAEIKIWRLWATWQNIELDSEFDIIYEKSFDIRDKKSDFELLEKAKELSDNQAMHKWIQKEIAKMLISNESQLNQVLESIESGEILLQDGEDNNIG